eukprot:scpid79637/ scgid19253/ ADP-ribosylation factor-related protein 1
MFSLVYGLWKYWFRKDEYYVMILGLDNAGKTTYLEKCKQLMARGYSGISLDRISPTVGMNVGRIDVSTIRLIFWDVGGQQDLQTLWEKYYTECHAIIYVVDSSDQARMDESLHILERLLGSDHLTGIPVLVVANKRDKESCFPLSDLKARLSFPSLKNRDCLVLEASAYKGSGIQDGIEWLVQCVQLNSSARPPHLREVS